MPDGVHRELETGPSVRDAATRRLWPVDQITAEVIAALASLPESDALAEARSRAHTISGFQSRVRSGLETDRVERRTVAALYIPDGPWAAIAHSPQLMDIYRRNLRPTLWGKLTGRPPLLWTRLVRDILVECA